MKELKEMYPDIEEYPAEYIDEYGYTCQLYWELAEEITIDEDGNHNNCQLDVSNEEYDEYAEYRENQFNK